MNQDKEPVPYGNYDIQNIDRLNFVAQPVVVKYYPDSFARWLVNYTKTSNWIPRLRKEKTPRIKGTDEN